MASNHRFRLSILTGVNTTRAIQLKNIEKTTTAEEHVRDYLQIVFAYKLRRLVNGEICLG